MSVTAPSLLSLLAGKSGGRCAGSEISAKAERSGLAGQGEAYHDLKIS